MSIAPQNLLTNSPSRLSFYLTQTHLKSTHFSLSLFSKQLKINPHFQILRTQSPILHNFKSFRTHQWPLRASEPNGALQNQHSIYGFNFDAFLSIFEFLFLASSVVISIGFAVSSAISGFQKPVLGWLGNRVFVLQSLLLVGGIVISSVIRRRQWRRICMDFSEPRSSGVNLVERIEKLEEDLRSSVTNIRVLSRHLEKLGIRFRVTRRTLKEPIAETAALAQKNSEATQALAVQEDILEKELGEVQKVLLAMQEQQLKQLELILAIGKSGKLWESKGGSTENQEAIGTCNSVAESADQMDINQIKAMAVQMESNNDRI